MPVWLGLVLALFLIGPVVFFFVAIFGWVFVGVVSFEAVALIAIDRMYAAQPAHRFRIGLVLVLLLAVTTWLYWRLGGSEPGAFALISVGMAVVGIAHLWRSRDLDPTEL